MNAPNNTATLASLAGKAVGRDVGRARHIALTNCRNMDLCFAVVPWPARPAELFTTDSHELEDMFKAIRNGKDRDADNAPSPRMAAAKAWMLARATATSENESRLRGALSTLQALLAAANENPGDTDAAAMLDALGRFLGDYWHVTVVYEPQTVAERYAFVAAHVGRMARKALR